VNVIPYNNEYERALIVSLLIDPLLLPKVQGLVEPEDFYLAKHQQIYRAITELEPENLDSLAVQDKLKDNVGTYFKELVEDSDKILPAISNAIYYAESIRDKSKLRAGINLGQEIIATCYNQTDAEEALHDLEDMFAKFLQKRVLEDDSVTTQESFRQFLEELNTREPDDPTAVKTGFNDLDLMIQRLEGMIVLAARTSMGKTSMALNIILNVLNADKSVVFFSLEQPDEQIFERMLAIQGDIPLEDIKMGIANPSVTLTKKMQKLFEKLHVDDTANVTNSYITSVARQKKFEWGDVGLIVVDYLHLMKLNDKQTVEALGDAVKELRGLGKELDSPVLLLAQLKRENDPSAKKGKRPDLSDLRSSGEIEQSADQVIFLHRESYYDLPGLAPDIDVTEVLIRKNRNGRTGIVMLEWLPKTTSFRNAR